MRSKLANLGMEGKGSSPDEFTAIMRSEMPRWSKLIKSSDDAPACTVVTYAGANSMIACTDWLFSGILERHPGIKVAFSEGGAGWVPYLLEQADHIF